VTGESDKKRNKKFETRKSGPPGARVLMFRSTGSFGGGRGPGGGGGELGVWEGVSGGGGGGGGGKIKRAGGVKVCGWGGIKNRDIWKEPRKEVFGETMLSLWVDKGGVWGGGKLGRAKNLTSEKGSKIMVRRLKRCPKRNNTE